MAKPTLDDLDAPAWFTNAAEELKATRPRWSKSSPPIALRSGGVLPEDSSPWLLGALAYSEAEAIRHDLLDLLKRHTDPASLDAWMAANLQSWVAGAAPARDAWVLTGAGFLGGDLTVSGLHETVRLWSKEKNRTLAVRGVDALGRIGSKTALEAVATLSAGLRDHSVADEAQQLMGSKAANQGASREQIEDRHVSNCGLDEKGERTFSYGPRSFRAALGLDLALSLYGEDGRKRASLPPPAPSDDRALAMASRAAWAETKTGVKRVLKAQTKRFEQAMITDRSWTLPDFREHVLRHALVARVARMLVWQTTGEAPLSLRVTEDFSFASAMDEAVSLDDSAQLRVAHPLRLPPHELKAWAEVFTDYGMVQPIPQLTRQVYCCEEQNADETFVAAPPHAPLKPGVLYGILDNDGWRLGRPVGAHFTYSWKSFATENVTVTIGYSGLLVGQIGQSPEQRVLHCAFHPGIMTSEQLELPGKPMRIGLAPPVAFSETMRRLLRLTAETA